MKNPIHKEKLEKALTKLNNTYATINCGGCGHFAKELGEVLKTKGYKVKYVLLLLNKSEVEYANKCIKKNEIDILNELSWAHVMVKTNGKLIDSEGIHNNLLVYKKRCYAVTLPELFLSTWLTPQYDHNWNSTFDRGIVPKIKKVLQKSLVD